MKIIDHKLIGQIKRAHFIGIGGVGMSAVARVLKHLGAHVTGTDAKKSARVDSLIRDRIPVVIEPATFDLRETDLVVYSSAIAPGHPELKEAKKRGIPIYHRAEVLASLFNQAKTSIGITGTHGKTTTSAMISYVLHELGRHPTCLVGGEMMDFETNTILGDPELWVAEVDESDQSHELYCPNYAVITNLEEDHLDHYQGLHEIQNSFRRFVENAVNPGLIVYCEDDDGLSQIVRSSGRPSLGYGFKPTASFSVQNVLKLDFGSEFDLCEAGFYVCRVKLRIPGIHNILNALATIAVLSQMGVDLGEICRVLANFRGTKRRLEVKWASPELTVIDDYAHHPTEVRAVIETLKNIGKPLTVVFQPHRYSRTGHFYQQFAKALEGVPELVLTNIYSAGEVNEQNVCPTLIFDELMARGHENIHWVEKTDLLTYLLSRPSLEGIVAFLGAGDIGEVADEFTYRLKNLTTA